MAKKRSLVVSAAILLIVLVSGALSYTQVLPGLSVARNEPPAMEVSIAQWLLRNSVPEEARSAVSPLGSEPDPADVAAGEIVYLEKCESCHAYDGSGRMEISAGLFPRPPALRDAVKMRTDGEIFYHIRNGIRNTGMPAWDMPDDELWQLVAYIRELPETAILAATPGENTRIGPVPGAHYVGSASCQDCHKEVYERWSKSLMANVVRDPREHPDAIIPDLSVPNPLLTFTVDDIALVYGSKWKQRYFTKIGDDYYPQPAQWDVINAQWRPYNVAVGTDWWTEHYPTDNFSRPTGALCDGCHSVNYNIADKSVTEWNVGCEKCHGPGSEHVRESSRTSILNPARMDYVQANDVCIQCHVQGQPVTNPIAGTYYDWPVGFHVGLELSDFWKMEEHTPGEQTFTHYAEGTGHKNRMQGNDYVQSQMYTHGVTCFTCHEAHGSDYDASLRKPVNEVCTSCHSPDSPSGPRAPSIAEHTHHLPDSAGSQCVSCHMPKIEQTIANVNVSSHTFVFATPAQTDALGIPNACNVCHTDKDTAWTSAALKTWTERSPWRMEQ
jgi:predicted CXXCH cytochrome family protein